MTLTKPCSKKDYADLAVWCNINGYHIKETETEYLAVINPAKSLEEISDELELAVERYLDQVAQTRGYKDIVSLCSYKGDADAIFNKEGTAGALWRGQVWRTCYSIRDSILDGTRTNIPTAEELIAELPVFTWGD